ncbi:serine hydrolase domain-containing protein [Flammeovirga aprica]|uniref:Serine hydrolase n=1 Tax=Flammeovirga aprica JL-4 TaxID=694437 RepID=A0A7X9S215_9BACT|nr:serine hydrolase domain-containing protein [Flammeovirga aprica]NME72933.1 serine hydrolase [Flammeovirga aprica JL-4]
MKLLFLFNFLLFFIPILKAQNTDFKPQVDSIVNMKMKEYKIPGISISVVKNGEIIYTKGYGVKEIGTDQKVTEHSVFHTASVSKLLTAQAVMQLVEDGKISLEDRLVDLLTSLNYSDKKVEQISLKSLLNHTSGLPDIQNYHWENNHQEDNSLSEYILNLKLKTKFPPKTEYKYSNLGYDILGLIVEQKSELLFEDYVAETILKPIGMAESDFRYFKISGELSVKPHTKKGSKIVVRNTYPYTREHAPSSTLNASAYDLSKWMIFFLQQLQKGKNSFYAQMQNPSTEVYAHIGLGFQIFEIDGHKVIGHFGGDKGFRSLLLMVPEKNIGVVVLGNCDYEEDYRQEILKPVIKMIINN